MTHDGLHHKIPRRETEMKTGFIDRFTLKDSSQSVNTGVRVHMMKNLNCNRSWLKSLTRILAQLASSFRFYIVKYIYIYYCSWVTASYTVCYSVYISLYCRFFQLTGSHFGFRVFCCRCCSLRAQKYRRFCRRSMRLQTIWSVLL